MLLRTGRYADCVPVAERLVKIRTAQAGGDAIQAAGARNQLALAYKLSGRVRDAIPLYEAHSRGLPEAQGARELPR